MKLHKNNGPSLIGSALILTLAVCTPLQAEPSEGKEMTKGKMMEHCREMMTHRQQMMETLKAQDASLTAQLAKVKSAPDDQKVEQMAALVTLMAEQRIATNEHRVKMEERMTKHMQRHMEMGKESMEDCPMLKTDTKKGDSDPDQHPE